MENIQVNWTGKASEIAACLRFREIHRFCKRDRLRTGKSKEFRFLRSAKKASKINRAL
jgi:hypothetical protein